MKYDSNNNNLNVRSRPRTTEARVLARRNDEKY